MTDRVTNLDLKKLRSLEALKKSGLPILKYKVLTKQNYQKELRSFLEENKITKFMVRTDGKGNFSPSIINVTLTDDVIKSIGKFFDEGFTVFIMEYANIYKDLHSLNILVKKNELIIEAVGQGFLATDLNRYGYLHECVEIQLSTGAIKQTYVISNDKYQQDKQKKILNVGIHNLEENDAYVLLYKTYTPLNKMELDYVMHSVRQFEMIKNILKEDQQDELLVSLSFLDLGQGHDEPIFWDAYCIK